MVVIYLMWYVMFMLRCEPSFCCCVGLLGNDVCVFRLRSIVLNGLCGGGVVVGFLPMKTVEVLV